MASQPRLLLGACVALPAPAAAAVPVLRSEGQCPGWEDVPEAGYGKRLFPNTEKPLFLLKLHFNRLAAPETSAGCAGLEQV